MAIALPQLHTQRTNVSCQVGKTRTGNGDAHLAAEMLCNGAAAMTFKLNTIVDLRAKNRRWVYVLNLCVIGWFALWSLEEGPLGLVLYVPLIVLAVVQYLRPTLVGWGVLFMTFAAFTAGALEQASFREDYVGVWVGLVLTVGLLWAYPKSIAPDLNQHPGSHAGS